MVAGLILHGCWFDWLICWSLLGWLTDPRSFSIQTKHFQLSDTVGWPALPYYRSFSCCGHVLHPAWLDVGLILVMIHYTVLVQVSSYRLLGCCSFNNDSPVVPPHPPNSPCSYQFNLERNPFGSWSANVDNKGCSTLLLGISFPWLLWPGLWLNCKELDLHLLKTAQIIQLLFTRSTTVIRTRMQALLPISMIVSKYRLSFINYRYVERFTA